MRSTRLLLIVAILLMAVASWSGVLAQEGSKLEEIRARGMLNCGVTDNVPGFSQSDPDTGRWNGLDDDFCRAVAVAVFGYQDDIDAFVNFQFLTASERFTALQSGDVDLLSRVTTWTFTRDTSLNSNFGPTTFYDGQGVMVFTSLGVSSFAELEGATFCTQTGTTTEKNIVDAYTQLFGMAPELVLAEDAPQNLSNWISGACDVHTTDRSALAAQRSTLDDPSSAVVLPDVLSKEPLGPMYLDDDPQWGDVIDWSVYATIQAEEFGITSENIDMYEGTDNIEIARFLGQDDSGLGALIGVADTFAADIVRTVGNYGEIYERNVVPIGLPREGTANELWTRGGLHYAPAWR